MHSSYVLFSYQNYLYEIYKPFHPTKNWRYIHGIHVYWTTIMFRTLCIIPLPHSPMFRPSISLMYMCIYWSFSPCISSPCWTTLPTRTVPPTTSRARRVGTSGDWKYTCTYIYIYMCVHVYVHVYMWIHVAMHTCIIYCMVSFPFPPKPLLGMRSI